MSNKHYFAKIPSVNSLLHSTQGGRLVTDYSKEIVTQGFRDAILKLKEEQLGKFSPDVDLKQLLFDEVRCALEQKFSPSLRRIINATGVVIHTNLGRAKLSPHIEGALMESGLFFTNVEYDIERGSRGSRYQHLEDILCDLTGAEAALVVNNNAAAVMLVLSTLAKEKEVVVSRGELVEIGGSFRIPEIISLSDCRLKEVGTTNKTHPYDYEYGMTENTAAILKVHTSNYKISGFTRETTVAELAEIVEKEQIPLIHDMGSGMLISLEKYGFPNEMTVADSLTAGADVVTFSGDKVLGGPQAGIIVGKKNYIDAMKKHQLTRALRVDKMTLATLAATLRLYYDEQEAITKIPTLKMLVTGLDELDQKAHELKKQLSILDQRAVFDVVDSYSQVGGGAYPGEEMASKAVAIAPQSISANQLERQLRQAPVPIIVKIRHQKCELDVRTIESVEFPMIVKIMATILGYVETGEVKTC